MTSGTDVGETPTGHAQNYVRRDPEGSLCGSPSHTPITVNLHLLNNVIIGNDQKAGLYYRVMGSTYCRVSNASREPGGVVHVGFGQVRQYG